MKNRVTSLTEVLVLVLMILLTVGLSFWLLNLPLFDFLIISILILFWTLIFTLRQVIYSEKEQRYQEKYEALKKTYQQTRIRHRNRLKDIESYFVIWVHQMKTPLTAMQLLLDNPNEDVFTQLKEEWLELQNYTNLALNYLKLTDPDRDLVIAPVLLDDLISPLLRKYRQQFIQKHLALDYDPLRFYILSDANLTSLQIEQLLNNALKYTQTGKISLRFDEEKEQLLIQDTGVGIREEDLPKIFDKGYSGFNGRLNDKSSGLGLYIVSLIAERLNQPVQVKSKLNEGTTFTLQLKRNRD